METRSRRAKSAPRDSVARLRQASERTLQPARFFEMSCLRNSHVFEDQLRSDRRTHRKFSVDVTSRESRRAFLDDETGYAFLDLRPHDSDVGDRSIRDPSLGPVENPAVAVAPRARFHPAWVRSMVRLGQPEASDQFSLGHFRQVALLLFLAAVCINRVHRKRALNRRKRAQSRVAGLQLLHDQPIRYVVHPCASVPLQISSEHSKLGHLRYEMHWEGFTRKTALDQRQDFTIDEALGRVAGHPLFIGQKVVEVKKIKVS